MVNKSEGIDGMFRAIVVNGNVVGSIAVERQADVFRLDGELGYMLLTEYWNHGIMSEVIPQTSKFYCKTNFDMAEIKAEEEDYANYPLPIAYDFKSVDARERILYMNYNRVKADVDSLILEVEQEFKK